MIELKLIKEGKKDGEKYKDYKVILKDEVYDRKIGKLRVMKGKRIFAKKVDSQVHKMKLFDAYGIQKDFFDEYLKGKNGKIIIYEEDTQNFLKSEIKTWEEKGRYANYGFGKQIFLSVKYMERISYE